MDSVYWPKIWVGPMGIFIVYVQVFKFAHVLKKNKEKKKDELAYLIEIYCTSFYIMVHIELIHTKSGYFNEQCW